MMGVSKRMGVYDYKNRKISYIIRINPNRNQCKQKNVKFLTIEVFKR